MTLTQDAQFDNVEEPTFGTTDDAKRLMSFVPGCLLFLEEARSTPGDLSSTQCTEVQRSLTTSQENSSFPEDGAEVRLQGSALSEDLGSQTRDIALWWPEGVDVPFGKTFSLASFAWQAALCGGQSELMYLLEMHCRRHLLRGRRRFVVARGS